MNPSNQIFYDIVAGELRMKRMDDGVWVRAFSDSAGNEELARAVYIKYRVAQLAAEQEVAVGKAAEKNKARLKQTKIERERQRDRIAVINSINLYMERKRGNPWFYDSKRRTELIFWVFMSLLVLGFLIAIFHR